MKRILIVSMALACAAFDATRPCAAAIVTIQADKDNSIFSEAASQAKSAGAALSVYTGTAGANASNGIRRGLVSFNLTGPGGVPVGATITSASLTMYVAIAPMNIPPGPALTNVSLYRLTSDWGEGTSFSGLGTGTGTGSAAQQNDTTWLYRFYNFTTPASSTPWSTVGGDFSGTVTATQSIGVPTDVVHDNYLWQSAQLTADVQSWYSNPAQNFGWILRGDEVTGFSTRRFFSSEFVDNTNFPGQYFGPLLTVQFDTMVPEPATWALLALGGVGILGWRRYSRRHSIP